MESISASIFSNGQRLRSGWRVALFFALFVSLMMVGWLVTGFLPAGIFDWVYLAVTLTAALLSGWIILARLDGRPIGALGFAPTAAVPGEVGKGLLIGGVLLAASLLLILATGGVGFAADGGTMIEYGRVLIGTFLFFGLAAAAEEAIFRGYPFQALVEGIGFWPAAVLASAVFSAMHGWNPNINAFALLNIFLAGVLLSVAYLRTRSLWFATALHLGWNWSMAALADLPVSGLEYDTPLYEAVETGADWWTGGAFGPEAGAAGTVVLVAGTVWLLHTRWLRVAPEMRRLGPIVDRRLETGEG